MRPSAPATWFALILTLALAAPVFAQAEDPAHGELRAMRTALLDAITKQDIDKVLPLLHPNVVVTWQNGEVNRGHAGVRAFFERMGRQSFGGYKVPPEPDELTILHGGTTGISFGRSVGQFNLLGSSWEFENRWTATLVKQNGQWLVASYHVSWNALDNPLLNTATRSLAMAAGGALLVGLALGMLLARRFRR
jgi:ketosteroid isomerase-like protein